MQGTPLGSSSVEGLSRPVGEPESPSRLSPACSPPRPVRAPAGSIHALPDVRALSRLYARKRWRYLVGASTREPFSENLLSGSRGGTRTPDPAVNSQAVRIVQLASHQADSGRDCRPSQPSIEGRKPTADAKREFEVAGVIGAQPMTQSECAHPLHHAGAARVDGDRKVPEQFESGRRVGGRDSPPGARRPRARSKSPRSTPAGRRPFPAGAVRGSDPPQEQTRPRGTTLRRPSSRVRERSIPPPVEAKGTHRTGASLGSLAQRLDLADHVGR